MTDIERKQLQRMGVPDAKLATIGLGIDLQQVTGGDGDRVRRRFGIDGPVVLHLGMKAYEKGSATLVEAMNALWQRGCNGWLVMAGPSLSAFDEYLSSQSGLLPKLINLPAFADDEKRDLLAAASVVAQPSRVESLGLVLMEAWANAKPVISADIEVSRKLVEDSGGGTVTRFGDSTELAKAIETLLAAPMLREEMGRRGQKAALAYDGNVLWPRNAEVFEHLAAAPGSPR